MTRRAQSRSTPAAIGLWPSEIHDVDFGTYDEATNTVACDRCGQRLDANAWAKPCIPRSPDAVDTAITPAPKPADAGVRIDGRGNH